MADYRLDRLSHRTFEHLIQCLCKKFIAVGMTPFGDGPDGGREASYEGPTSFPADKAPWNGVVVAQCKFRQRSSNEPDSDSNWILGELSKELKKYPARSKAAPKEKKSNYKTPDFLLIASNVILSPVKEKGGLDKCLALLKSEAQRIGLSGYAIWGYDELCRFIDLSPEIRQTFSGFILPDDILHEAISLLDLNDNNFEKVISRFIQKELKADYAAKLQSAGQFDEQHEIPLANVFIDLPFSFDKSRAVSPTSDHKEIVDFFLKVGDEIISVQNNCENDRLLHERKAGRYVVVGGPGQGKSTIGQYLCQLYRAEIASTLSNTTLEPSIQKILPGLLRKNQDDEGENPVCRRFPFRIILNSFATDLANDRDLTVLEYIRRRLTKLGNADNITINQLQKWLSGYPWLFVLDGLDEVPASSNRKDVLSSIEDFLVDLTTNETDVLIIATTRPQGYSDDLAGAFFKPVYLAPLSAEQALAYGTALLRYRARSDEDRFDQSLRRLRLAGESPSTLRLMRSPLQVTIMATLVERLGDPPKQKYRLFAEYYRTIYDREISREGILSRLLSDRKTDIDIIHHRTGLLLQTASENAGDTLALFSIDEFIKIVKYRLVDELGETPERADSLISQIKVSALDRLVFLVSPQNDQVGFEIRSLQEFMAAEALYKGDSFDVISRRINAIGPVSHWRNVLLFFIGRCFSEDNNPLLDRVLVLCEELNDVAPEYSIVKWGAQIALEAISDGGARNNPRRERRLCSIALKLLDSQVDDYSSNLMAIHHDGLDDLFRDKISLIMRSSNLQHSLGAWRLLQGLISKNTSWAKEIFSLEWEKITPTARSVVLSSEYVASSSWVLEKALSCIPFMSPFAAFSIFGENQIEAGVISELRRNTSVPEWAEPFMDSRTELWDIIDTKREVLELQGLGNEIEDRIVVIFQKMELDNAGYISNISQMPFVHEGWVSYVAVAKFLENPNKDSLADALEMFLIGNCFEQKNDFSPVWNSPWPMQGILNASSNKDTLKKKIENVRKGHLFDFEHWSDLEKSLSEGSVCIRKLEDESDLMPISAFRLGLPDIDNPVKKLIELWHGERSFKTREWLACGAFRVLSSHNRRRMKIADRVDIDLDRLLEMLSSTISMPHTYEISIFNPLNIISNHAPEYVFEKLTSMGIRFNFQVGYREENWLETQFTNAVRTYGICGKTIKWGLWLFNSGGCPGFNKTQIDAVVDQGLIANGEKFQLRIGAVDFSLGDAIDAVSSLIGLRHIEESDRVQNLVNQIEHSIDILDSPQQILICVGLLDHFKWTLTLEESKIFSFSFIEMCMKRIIQERKSSFFINSQSARDLGFSM